MQRAPLGQIAMDSASNISPQSMTQLLQSCTALHAVSASTGFQLETGGGGGGGGGGSGGSLQVREPESPDENDENAGPIGGAQRAKVEVRADLAQLAALRRTRAPTMSRRNERERNRVRYLNFTFDVLRQHLPRERAKGKAKKMSKVDTLRGAIDYIRDLQDVLGDGITKVVDGASPTDSRSPTAGGASFAGTESEPESLSPVGSPRGRYCSGGLGSSPGGGDGAAGAEGLSDQEDVLGGTELAGWFC